MAEEGRDDKGLFQPGNKFWEARSSSGANPKFSGPDELWPACVEYFEWVEANPLAESIAYQGKVSVDVVPKMRAMTIQGLCNFLDISKETWLLWRNTRTDLIGVVKKVESIIYQQKFEGASGGFLNPNIIARDLGLSDKKELTGANGGAIKTETNLSNVSLENLEAAKKLLLGDDT